MRSAIHEICQPTLEETRPAFVVTARPTPNPLAATDALLELDERTLGVETLAASGLAQDAKRPPDHGGMAGGRRCLLRSSAQMPRNLSPFFRVRGNLAGNPA
jgi:hypothetical protein